MNRYGFSYFVSSANAERISSSRHILAGASEKVQVQSPGPFEAAVTREEGMSHRYIEAFCEAHVDLEINF